MSELGDELHRLADQGAEHARPLPAAEVIRRGDHRRQRRVVRGAVATLAVAGAVTAGVLSSVAGSGHQAPAQPASRPSPSAHLVTSPAVSSPRPVPSSAGPSATPTPTPSGGTGVPVPSGTS